MRAAINAGSPKAFDLDLLPVFNSRRDSYADILIIDF